MAPMRARMTSRISRPTGHCPKSSVQATRRRPRSTGRARAISSGRSGKASGSRSSMPTWAANSRRTSATVRPMGPSTEIGVQPRPRRSIGTTPGDGRKPTTPHTAAGMRSEPPVSEPVQTGSMSQASATAEPPDEPPAFSAGIERIAGRAPHGIARIGAGPELGHVGLGDDHRAGLAHQRHHGGVGLRHEVAMQRRAVGGEQALGLVQVLDAGRQAVQGPERLAPQCRDLRRLGLGACARVAGRGDGIDGGVDRLDAGDRGLHQLDRRDLLGADAPAQLHGGKRQHLVVACRHAMLPSFRSVSPKVPCRRRPGAASRRRDGPAPPRAGADR